ncbi:MAG: hypothetical protein SPJ04_07415 [Bdellovibrionota bacterium]|nr:hypothetical protein [Pseudomonadota bacterium]MDY6091063.1 hypothetical protein [Bdellovibrionota bacterium]
MTENNEKRERTKTVMLGPDITKEIRSQLEEYNLESLFDDDKGNIKEKEKLADTLPQNFFYNNGKPESNDSNDGDDKNKRKDTTDVVINDDKDYSIFAGENPIKQIQESLANNEEVLVNNCNKEHQKLEVSRAKKETEEIASKIIKDLVLDQIEQESSVKNSLIKELESENEMFEKFEYKNGTKSQNDKENIYNILNIEDTNNQGLENNNSNETNNYSSSIFDDIGGEVNNGLSDNNEPISHGMILQKGASQANDTNNNIANTSHVNKNNQEQEALVTPKKENDEYKATQLKLEDKFKDIRNGIYWKEQTPLIGFLITFNNNPNGDFYELREGKLVITSQMNKNMNSLVINDESIAVMHAVMKITSNKITLLDPFGENVTTLKHFNSDEVIELSEESEIIKDKDIVTFGNVTFKVCLI